MSETRAENIGVGVLGASGYIGAELLRYLIAHPHVEIRWASAHSSRGKRIGAVLPNLDGLIDGEFVGHDEAEARLDEARAVFVALPHNQSQEVIPKLASAAPETVFIDMAGDFRTPDSAGYEKYYGKAHSAPEWLERFVYGFTELQRPTLRGARLIANPGCFATGILIALAPLAEAGLLEGDVCITGITGSSGSGNKPSATTHHPERATNVRCYKPLVHQHLLEVEGFLRTRTPSDFRLQFVPQSGPFVRGIYATVFLPGAPVEKVRSAVEALWGAEPLVTTVDGSPDLRCVQGTPRAAIGVAGSDERGAVVFSVIDNLGKGAAGQAVHNFNIALGLDELDGLRWPGGFV